MGIVDIHLFASGFSLSFNSLRIMTERHSVHLFERLLILIAAFLSFRILLTLAIGASADNLTSGVTNGYYCIDNYNWKAQDVTRQDCFAAIGLLYRSEVGLHGDKDFEFLSARAIKRLGDSMRTPRRYTVGECENSS